MLFMIVTTARRELVFKRNIKLYTMDINTILNSAVVKEIKNWI